LGAINLLVRTFWVFVCIYRHIWHGIKRVQRIVHQKQFPANGTYSDQNVGCGVFSVFVRTSWVVYVNNKKDSGCSYGGGHFFMFVDGCFSLLLGGNRETSLMKSHEIMKSMKSFEVF
jgi:hypothetical protein